jgi:fimbrial chaperone protein
MSVGGALRWIAAVVAASAPWWAAAASFGVAPIGLTIASNENSGSVVVTNTGADPVVIQARAFAWTQSVDDVRTETRDLIINPPLFKLAAGESQLVRVASRRAAPEETELAFRLAFSEVPLLASAPGPGLRVTLSLDVPLYIAPRRSGSPAMAWRFEDPSGKPRVLAENSGNRHLRLRDVKVMDGEKELASVPRLVVLAKSSFAVSLTATPGMKQSLRLTGQDDDNQPVDVDIPVHASRQ